MMLKKKRNLFIFHFFNGNAFLTFNIVILYLPMRRDVRFENYFCTQLCSSLTDDVLVHNTSIGSGSDLVTILIGAFFFYFTCHAYLHHVYHQVISPEQSFWGSAFLIFGYCTLHWSLQ